MRNGFKINEVYYIQFLDHATGREGSVLTELVGRVFKETKHDVILSGWTLVNESQEVKDLNDDYFSIVKKTIFKKRKIKSFNIPKDLLEEKLLYVYN